MTGYRSPALEARLVDIQQRELEDERRRQPRADWTDLTFEEFQALSGAERNQLFHTDPDRYQAMTAEGATR